MSFDAVKSAKERLRELVSDLKLRIATRDVSSSAAEERRLGARELQLKAARLEAKLDGIEAGDVRAGSAIDLDLRTLKQEIELLMPAPVRRRG